MEFSQSSIPSNFFICQKKFSSKNINWTLEEDSFLLKEAELTNFKNWKCIAKRINKHFTNSYKSSNACRKRALFLIKEKSINEPWTSNEDLVMLIAYYQSSGKWSSVCKCLPKRRKIDIKTRLSQILLEVSNKISDKNEQTIDKDSDTPLEKLKIYLCTNLAVQYLDKQNCMDRKAGKFITQFGISSKEWLENLSVYMGFYGKIRDVNLNSYIEEVMEKLQNNLIDNLKIVEKSKKKKIGIAISELKKVHYAIQD